MKVIILFIVLIGTLIFTIGASANPPEVPCGIECTGGGGGYNVINGTSWHDTINGTPGDDWINGNAGQDTIHGWGGNDVIYGGDGKDILYGDAGNDSIYGGENDSTMTFGGPCFDFGGPRAEVLYGNYGVDVVDGQGGIDCVFTANDGSVDWAWGGPHPWAPILDFYGDRCETNGGDIRNGCEWG